jgi:PAS domain S-box-containing protein
MATTLQLAGRLSAVVATQQEVLAAITDLDKVMDLVVERVPEVTSGSGAVIEIVDGEELVYRAASGEAKGHVGMRLPFRTSLSGLAVMSKTLVRSDDTEKDARVDAKACRAIGIRSMIIAPLLEADVAVGALKTFSPRPNTFDELDTYALQLLAGMASGALTQARTFREREASEARYRMLFDRNVAGVFRSTLDGDILDCNDALVGCLGYDERAELLACSAWDFYHERSAREELLEMVQKSGSLLNARVALKRKDGTSMLCVLTASLVPGEDNETHLLGTIVEA